MKLNTLLELARNGELKGLSAKDKPDSVVIGFINTALVAIYNRFAMDFLEVKINLQEGKTLYTIGKNSQDVVAKIVEVNYGKKELSKVISAKDSLGNTLSINDSNDEYTVTMYSYDNVQISSVRDNVTYVTLIISTMPNEIADDADLDSNIDLPRFMIEPLLHYVGYRAYSSLDSNVNTENSVHLIRFHQSCDEIETRGLIPGDNTTRTTVAKGFDRGYRTWQFPL